MKSDITLGQRVYGVSSAGEIIPTLVNVIELQEHEGEEESLDLSSSAARIVEGVFHMSAQGVKFQALNKKLSRVFATFDEAREEALRVVNGLIDDDTITVANQRKFKVRQEQLLSGMGIDQERDLVDGVTEFSESLTMIASYLNKGKERMHAQADFPNEFIQLGTPVWVVVLDNWAIIEGYITRVEYAPAWPDSLLYCCGGTEHVSSQSIFLSKEAALETMEKIFSANLPGTLDRARVTIVPQVSKQEARKRRKEKIEEQVEEMFSNDKE